MCYLEYIHVLLFFLPNVFGNRALSTHGACPLSSSRFGFATADGSVGTAPLASFLRATFVIAAAVAQYFQPDLSTQKRFPHLRHNTNSCVGTSSRTFVKSRYANFLDRFSLQQVRILVRISENFSELVE
jgi:hypothetical protein